MFCTCGSFSFSCLQFVTLLSSRLGFSDQIAECEWSDRDGEVILEGPCSTFAEALYKQRHQFVCYTSKATHKSEQCFVWLASVCIT